MFDSGGRLEPINHIMGELTKEQHEEWDREHKEQLNEAKEKVLRLASGDEEKGK